MRIVAFAYACEPGKGSEPGAGWVWSRMLACLGEVWVITRENNRPALETVVGSTGGAERTHFVYVDLPRWAGFWKRGQRGVRIYYLLWQLLALRRARRLNREVGFDLVWHLTFANAWLGSLASLVGPTFLYGPVGGGVRMPWRLLPALGWKGAGYEFLRGAARIAGRRLNPLARLAWSRAALILVQNAETRDWLPRRHRAKAVVFPHVALGARSGPVQRRIEEPQTALFVGRLLPWKGASLAIATIASVSGWRLLIVGDGPDASRLARLAPVLGVADRVDFLGARPRDDVLRLMQKARVLLFPSLHDEAGWVVVEALSAGLPVICLDRGGPAALAGRAGSVVPASGSFADVVASLSRCLAEERFAEAAVIAEQSQRFSPECRAGELAELVAQVGPQSEVVTSLDSAT